LNKSGDKTHAEHRRWIVSHAVRLPAKRDVARAVRIRAIASRATSRQRQPRG
jgi:hypothetical protein